LCRVCGDRASGFHYGVHACEGCKVSDCRLTWESNFFTQYPRLYQNVEIPIVPHPGADPRCGARRVIAPTLPDARPIISRFHQSHNAHELAYSSSKIEIFYCEWSVSTQPTHQTSFSRWGGGHLLSTLQPSWRFRRLDPRAYGAQPRRLSTRRLHSPQATPSASAPARIHHFVQRSRSVALLSHAQDRFH